MSAAHAPASALYVALGAEADERFTESVTLAADRGIPILEVPRSDLDRMSANGLHQGIALQVPPYAYAHPDDLLAEATSDAVQPALLVALDNISDPRNLGAIVRSVAAFAGHGVLIPQRRSASVTAVAWRTSAGAAARVPIARATNLNRTLKEWADAGVQVVGLDADGDTTIDEFDGTGPVVVVVGSEGKGLSRLVRQNCDAVISIPMAARGVAERVRGGGSGARRDRTPAPTLTFGLRPGNAVREWKFGNNRVQTGAEGLPSELQQRSSKGVEQSAGTCGRSGNPGRSRRGGGCGRLRNRHG